MTTLVTGAPGWLGSLLVRRLCESGRQVRCLVYEKQPNSADVAMKHLGAQVCRGDILNNASVQSMMDGVDSVFHVAGVLHHQRATIMADINARGTAVVANAAARAKVKRFVYVSSISVHGYNSSTNAPFTEEQSPNPPSVYARSKLEGEIVLRGLAHQGDLPSVVLRPGPFYGPGNSRGMRMLVNLAQALPIAVFRQGNYYRSLVHIENVVDALLLAEQSNQCLAEPYLIGDSEPYSILDLLNAIGDASGKAVQTVAAPQWIANVSENIARLAEDYASIHLSLPSMIAQFGQHAYCSIDRAREELGYEPQRSLHEGIQDMLRAG